MNQITLRHRLLLLTLLPSTLIAIALVTYFTISGMRTLDEDERDKWEGVGGINGIWRDEVKRNGTQQ